MSIELAQPDLSALDALDSAFTGRPCVVVAGSGGVTRLALHSWLREPDDADCDLFLDHCTGPSLDIGCGPGRLTAALTARSVPALGIDISREAVRLTRRRGARATRTDVFAGGLPHGRWLTALLADGNIGIGGDPARLLRRVRDLLAPGGVVLVELEPPGTRVVHDRLRLRVGDRVSAAFDWAFVGVDAIDDLAVATGLSMVALHESGGRFVGTLARGRQRAGGHDRAVGGARWS
jgi:SAM-dependent methyltransferase